LLKLSRERSLQGGDYALLQVSLGLKNNNARKSGAEPAGRRLLGSGLPCPASNMR